MFWLAQSTRSWYTQRITDPFSWVVRRRVHRWEAGAGHGGWHACGQLHTVTSSHRPVTPSWTAKDLDGSDHDLISFCVQSRQLCVVSGSRSELETFRTQSKQSSPLRREVRCCCYLYCSAAGDGAIWQLTAERTAPCHSRPDRAPLAPRHRAPCTSPPSWRPFPHIFYFSAIFIWSLLFWRQSDITLYKNESVSAIVKHDGERRNLKTKA